MKKLIATDVVANKLGEHWTLQVGSASYRLKRGSVIHLELTDEVAQELRAFGYLVADTVEDKPHNKKAKEEK